MAWYRCMGGGSSPAPVNTIRYYSGKINIRTGVIVEDSDYCYTDYISLPNGYLAFDMGLSSGQDYAGVAVYTEDKQHLDYWQTTSRNRSINLSTNYSNGGRYFRLSFPVANANYLYAHDMVNHIMYCYDEPVQISND